MALENQKPNFMFVYFSELQGARVFDKDNQPQGVLHDIIIEPLGKYARSKTLIVEAGGFHKSWASVDWSGIAEITQHVIRLNLPASDQKFSSSVNNHSDLSIRQDILYQQVVDTNNQNVIRVNDIQFLQAKQDLVVAHVDIGLRGIVRRLGLEKFLDPLVRIFNKNSEYLNKPSFITWKHIQPLSINPVSKTIKVDVSQKMLREIPAADLSEIMLDLAPQDRLALFKVLDLHTKSRLFAALDFKEQKSLLEDLSEKEAVEILNNIPKDEAADFLGDLPEGTVNKILGLMESKNAKMLSKLLGYSEESAGGLMTTEYIAVPDTATIEQALKIVKEKTLKAETIHNIFIVDKENHLAGSTVLRRLITADPPDEVMKAALKKTVKIHVEDDVKRIALLMDKYKVNAVPVVDASNILIGIITMDDIFSRLVAIAWRRAKRKIQL